MSHAPDPQESSLIGEGARSVTTVSDEAGRLAQALIDLKQCRGASLTVTHCPEPAREGMLARQLLKTARDSGFVSAHVSLEQHPLDAIDGLVSAVLDAVVPPSDSRPKGGILRL